MCLGCLWELRTWAGGDFFAVLVGGTTAQRAVAIDRWLAERSLGNIADPGTSPLRSLSTALESRVATR